MEEDIQKSFWAFIPSMALSDKNLCSTEKLMLAEIYSLANQYGICYPSNKHFADLFDISERLVRRYLAHLQKEGWIEIILEEGYKRVIRINFSPLDDKLRNGYKKVKGGRNYSSGGEEIKFRGGGTIVPHRNTYRNTYRNTHKICNETKKSQAGSDSKKENIPLKEEIEKNTVICSICHRRVLKSNAFEFSKGKYKCSDCFRRDIVKKKEKLLARQIVPPQERAEMEEKIARLERDLKAGKKVGIK